MFFQIELLVLACYFQVIVVSFHVLPALFAQLRHPYAEETHVNVAPARHSGSPLDFAPRTAGEPAAAPIPGQFRRKGAAAKIWMGVLVGIVVVVAILVYLVFGNLK